MDASASDADLRVRKKPKHEHVSSQSAAAHVACEDAVAAIATPASGPAKGESVVELIAEKLIGQLRAGGGDGHKMVGIMELYHNIICSTRRTADSVRGLQSAVAMGDVRIVRCLIDKGVSLRFNTDKNPCMAPMAIACKHGYLEIAQLLHESGASVHGVCSGKNYHHYLLQCITITRRSSNGWWRTAPT